MKTYSSKRAIIAVAAIVALIGSVSVFTAEAAPVIRGINVRAEPQGEPLHQAAAAVFVNMHKRQAVTTHTTADTKAAAPTTTEKPKTTAAAATKDPAKTTTTHAAAGATTTHAATSKGATGTATSGGVAIPATGVSSGATPSASSGTGSDNGVPTQVSEKVFIGLGTVGGFLVFALGGLAFCRHRKKKNLASALLQQTAQFNNNNPYAKLPEPAASPKESLPMTPTKPLGTYTVVGVYTPALPDEIELGLGDSVTISQEYDDGWCMGVNNSRGGIKGVFPRHCVEMGAYEGSQHGAPGGPHFPPSPSFKAAANKRISSIAPAGGWNGPGYHGDGGNFPPQPSPHYLEPSKGADGFYGGGGY